MPFLYLQDAVTLTLLLILFSLLREAAVVHLQQELSRIRKELFVFAFDNHFPHTHPAYEDLRTRIESATRLASKLTPGRLFFVHRLFKEMPATGHGNPVDWHSDDFAHEVASIENRRVAEKVHRFRLEIDFSLGTFFLLGSISGWILLFAVLSRVIFRILSRRSHGNLDARFDLAEKVLARIGRQAQMVALLSEAGSPRS